MADGIELFCTNCLRTVSGAGAAARACPACGGALLRFYDAGGAISRAYLVARGRCCGSGCRNCPYPMADEQSDKPRRIPKMRTCPACGTTFECFNGECWCAEVQLSADTLKRLEKLYEGCLCRGCLTRFASPKTDSPKTEA